MKAAKQWVEENTQSGAFDQIFSMISAIMLVEQIQEDASIESCKEEHNFEIAKKDFYKLSGELGPAGPTYKQDETFSTLYCRKCGITKEIKTS